MNAKEFFDLVRSLRRAQKECVKSRGVEALQRKEELEKKVDDEINRVSLIEYRMRKEGLLR